jgi:hypothetical protein
MKLLLDKSKVNHGVLKKFLLKVVSEELLNLTENCYYPKIKKYYFNLLQYTKLTEKDAKELTKKFYEQVKLDKSVYLMRIHDDPITNLIVFIMNYFLVEQDIVGYTTITAYFVIRNYANLLHRQMRFCDPDAFKFAMEHLAKTHLFIREKTLPNSLYFMAREIMKKYSEGIADGDPIEIAKMITETRTRIQQSLRSFAEAYYAAVESNTVIKNPYESENDTNDKKYQEQSQDRFDRIVDVISKKITVYKFLDKKAMIDAKTITKINISLATLLSSTLTEVRYLDNVKLILKLFIKDMTSVKTICGKEYLNYLRNFMSIKRTTSVIYFKQQIAEIVEKIIDDINYREKYNSLSNQSKFMINLYIALYLTMILKNTLC